MKHRVVHALQKYVLNPPIKLLFALGIAPQNVEQFFNENSEKVLITKTQNISGSSTSVTQTVQAFTACL